MDTKELIQQIRENYLDSDLDQLEVWYGQLATTYAWIATQLGETKRDRALEEIKIKQALIAAGEKPTEKEVERKYFATHPGQYLALHNEYIKAVGKLLSAVRFRIEALKGIR